MRSATRFGTRGRRPTTPGSHRLVLAAGAALVGAVAGCGSSTTGAHSPSVTPTVAYSGAPSGQPSGGAATATPSAAPSPSAAGGAGGAGAPPSVAPAGAEAQPGVPAVTGATDVTKQPTVAKGTGTVGTRLVVRDLVVGTGAAAAPGAMVSVRYVGAIFATGTVFDASWKQGDAPVQFSLQGVIPGFAQGIPGMKVGGRREIVIPPGPLGYQGGNAQAGIGPNDALVFIVDLVDTTGGS